MYNPNACGGQTFRRSRHIDRLALVKQAIDANCGIAQSVGSLRRRE